ncbi:DUF3426 domain-containing protein [Pseudomonas sp. LS1212]|uniref:DUF3426 domain-containing protein n=1 Tax=Pseudomonas sp. LS1212 TaxID=2972478 RepID=UPI00215CBD64|nr:DUF3426 domain-containing protein [Pseudomonas sp. LS1212]UVJ44558.1 DUF3426 domain-containing protein [Pseudomonas sp. LS1212]
MTDSFVTQCPHCQTSFRVSHNQLSVARGVVRCGACLRVFNAARQLLEQSATDQAQPPAPLPPPAADQAPEQQPPVGQREWSAADLDLDELDLDGELAKLEQREIQPTMVFTHAQVPREDSLSAQRDTPDTEETWPDSLFSEPASEREAPDMLVADAAPPIIEQAPQDLEPVHHERTEPSISLDTLDLDEAPQAAPLHPDAPPSRHESREHFSALDSHDDLDQDEHHEPEPVRSREKHSRNEPALHDDALNDLVDDPLQLDWQKRRSPWGRRLLWLLLILLAAAALAGQYIWYHFDELARQDQYRPWFQQLCPKIGCTVPSKVDIALIKSSNLVVRSHPEFKGALIVDAIIYNRATFSQPFPLLELRFADLNGQLIASRRFKPGEYLSGDLVGKAEMPPQTPIHIALDILDPGPKAVNYSLSFRSPE